MHTLQRLTGHFGSVCEAESIEIRAVDPAIRGSTDHLAGGSGSLIENPADRSAGRNDVVMQRIG